MEQVPGWVDLVEAWFDLESAKGFLEVNQGKGLPGGRDHPKAVGTWVQSGRSDRVPTSDPDGLQTQLLHWWKVLNPPWRQMNSSGEFLQSGDGDWGVLDVCGHNGFLTVLACTNWWYDLGDDDMDNDP
ncbi:hypothetical protein BT96DRAFT_825526 [Gymnopus androsaceus JB14]|uniref:Uncharacterized protein n=1 Tax=Gymnopus androsaceus JB14 TaxID=1447944 RepID=A0A6A4HC40_9AGAR|nr:hypothetical protein BT96DRAFT_825526 [Gymnopus androsaceus JB14]